MCDKTMLPVRQPSRLHAASCMRMMMLNNIDPTHLILRSRVRHILVQFSPLYALHTVTIGSCSHTSFLWWDCVLMMLL